MAKNIQREHISGVVNKSKGPDSWNPGIEEPEEDTIENKAKALEKLLDQFDEYITYWDDSGFNITDFKTIFEGFRRDYEEWKGKREWDSLNEFVGDKIKKIYDEFFIVRNRVDKAQLLLEEMEDLYAIDMKVPRDKIIGTIKNLEEGTAVEKRMKSLKELVYRNNNITTEILKKRALDYVRTIKDEVQELQKKGEDIGRSVVHLNKAKKLFSKLEIEKAINICRLVRVEIKYSEGLRAIRLKKKLSGKTVKKKIVKRQKGKGEVNALIKKCAEMLKSAKELISKLHGSGKDINDLLRIYMKARPALKKKDYETALNLAMEVHDIAQGMMVPPQSEEQLGIGRYGTPDDGFDFEIVSERYTPLEKEEKKEPVESFVIEFECSECGSFVPGDAEVCPNCNESFREAESPPVEKEGLDIIETGEKEKEFYIPTTVETFPRDEEAPHVLIEREQLEEIPVGDPLRKTQIAPETGTPFEEKRAPKDEEAARTHRGIQPVDWRGQVEPETWVEVKVEDAVKKSPPEDQVLRLIKTKQQEAEDLANEGRLHEALEVLNAVLNIKPGHPPALNDKGTILFTLGEVEKALVMYDMALESDPKIIDTWTNKGFALHQMGNLTGAFYCYERALALNPNNTEVLSSIGALYFEIDKYEKAMKYFEKATEIKPGDPDLWYYSGFTNEILEKWHAAQTCYDEVLKLKPLHEEALSGREKCNEKLRMQPTIHNRENDYENRFFQGFYNK